VRGTKKEGRSRVEGGLREAGEKLEGGWKETRGEPGGSLEREAERGWREPGERAGRRPEGV
jgi:hypothetical protein